MKNEVLKEYLRNQNNADENYKIILEKSKRKSSKFYKITNIAAVILVIMILGTVSNQIYAKRQWDIKFEEYQNREYEFQTIGIAESNENGYAEKIDMDYVFQNDIGVKINSVMITDDYFETYIDFKFPENMEVSYKDFCFGYAVYDNENNAYGYQVRTRRANIKENYKYDSDYIKCLLKEIDAKYVKKEGIWSAHLDNFSSVGPVSSSDRNIISKISMDSEKGFPRSKKLYIRVFDLGMSMMDYEEQDGNIKVLDREDFTLSGEAEWIFEINIPERIYNRETINLGLKDDIPGLEVEKITVTESKLLIKGKMDFSELLVENMDLRGCDTLLHEKINITDKEGNIYYNLVNASFGNNFYFGFDINKEMLEEKQLFLNVKIDGKIYTEELIK